MDDFLLNALLALPNNYRDVLMDGRRPSVARWLLRRAEEFLEAHATEPMTISDMLEHLHDFKEVWSLGFDPGGWYTDDQIEAIEREIAEARAMFEARAGQAPRTEQPTTERKRRRKRPKGKKKKRR